MQELSAVRRALSAGELDAPLSRLMGGRTAEQPQAGGGAAGRLPADLRRAGGHLCHPVLCTGPDRDLRQPYRPPARPGAGGGGQSGFSGLRRPQRHEHHPLPVGGLAPGGGGSGHTGAPGGGEGDHRRPGAGHGGPGRPAGLSPWRALTPTPSPTCCPAPACPPRRPARCCWGSS